VLLAALIAANLPFVLPRRFGFWQVADGRKSLGWHLLELLLMYFLVGALGLALEQNAGQIAPQGWEFYAITVCLFLTLAFPGFVWRFLLKHGG
jgi:Na+(H+)/acetate symporter ActP